MSFMKFSPLLLLTAAAALVPAYSQAATHTQYATDVTLALGDDTIYSLFNKFNSSWGTLNSVTLSIDALNLSGSIVLTQGSGNGLFITNFHSDLDLNAGTAGAGYNGLSGGTTAIVDAVNLTVANQTMPFAITKNTITTFTFNNQNALAIPRTFDVSSGNFTGTGYAPSFTLYYDTQISGNTNLNSSFNWNGLSSKANLSLTYDYNAIPEPSTYGIGLGILALAAVAVRRRKVKA